MWRDMQRLTHEQGLPFRRPVVFPQNTVLAARVATVAARDGWINGFAPAVYHANFAEGRDLSDPMTLAPLINAAGAEAEAVLVEAQSQAVKAELRAATDEAASKGVFGAPSFVTDDGELFWGHDRMDQAINWAALPALRI